ncbi:hypothetical protein HD806DRAFT_478238 [Xylariaceae sp. AK1471]|nr:hypothetical protein HD806DRAFT_478238 [Xylariaceae sp. AK1471]
MRNATSGTTAALSNADHEPNESIDMIGHRQTPIDVNAPSSRCYSTTPEPTSNNQPSSSELMLEDGSSFSRPVFHPDDSSGGEEDDVYLFDVPSSQVPDVNTTGAFADEAEELAEIALEEFLLTISPLSGNAKRGRDWRLPGRARKRLRTSCIETHVEIEQKSETDDEDTVVVGSPRLTTHQLACPFYVRHKETHLSCLTRADLREIKDLKRHLWSAHRQPPYCPTCYNTFISAEDCNKHIRLRSCISSGKLRPEGVSAVQMQRLARRADPWISREVQWLTIWEITFPGARLPSLAYLSGEVETVVCALRDFWSTEGDRIVFGFLAERQQQSPQLQDEKPNVTTLSSAVLNRVIDQLVASCRQHKSDEQRSREIAEEVLSSWRLYRRGNRLNIE